MIEILIDEIDLLTPPFANDEVGELCGGKITSAAAITKAMSNRPLLSGFLASIGIFDETQTRVIPMFGKITSQVFIGSRVSIKPVISGALKSIGIIKNQLSKTISSMGKITAMPALGGEFSIRPICRGVLSSIGIIGGGEFDAHICGGVK